MYYEDKELAKSYKHRKNFIKSITWRKPFFIRIFCKHEYQTYKWENPVQSLRGETLHKICKKCGKYKSTLYREYE